MLIQLMHTSVTLTVNRVTHDLSPCPSSPDLLTPVSPVCDTDNFQQQPIENVNEPRTNSDHSCAPDETLNVCRSGRVRKVPDRYGY